MSNLKLTSSLLSMLESVEQHGGKLLMLSVTASEGQDGKLNKLRGAGYVVKCDHPSVTEGGWPAEALAITEAGRTALGETSCFAAKRQDSPLGRSRRRREEGATAFRRQKGDISSRWRALHCFSRGRSDRVRAAYG